VDHSGQHPRPNIGIMLYFLMTIIVNVGYFSCRKMIKLSQSLVSLKHWWRKSWARRLKLYGVIMVVSMYQMCLITSMQWKGLNKS